MVVVYVVILCLIVMYSGHIPRFRPEHLPHGVRQLQQAVSSSGGEQ